DFAARNRLELIHHKVALPDRVTAEDLRPTVEAVVRTFLERELREVVVAYATFRNLLSQVATVKTLLPVPKAGPDEGPQTQGDYIYEPEADKVLDRFIPQYLQGQILRAVLENQASEHSARMVAMRNASTSAGDVIRELSLTANKVRQANITRELMEIVGGAEALAQARR
ncbi:MAG: F0F1 ATP synthase subunit gamma, partial [Candidatus Dormibacteria bacterium]